MNDPDAFAAALNRGFAELADPEYLDGQRRVAPGIGRLFGVRWPLNAAVDRGFRAATRRSPTTGFLEVAARLFAEPELEPRWFAFGLLDRLLVDDTERAWQLLRRAAREAGDWITVDSLAHPVGRGILLEPYRWAELDSLVFSPSRWERRLVGSSATLPYVDHRRGRTADVTRHGLALVDELIGDDQPDVQKALAWALRSMALVDPIATAGVRRAPGRARRRESRRPPGVGPAGHPGQAPTRGGRRDPRPPRRDPPAIRRSGDVAGGVDRRPVRRPGRTASTEPPPRPLRGLRRTTRRR